MGDHNSGDVREALRAYIQIQFPAATNMDLSDNLSLLDSGIVDSMGILDLVAFIEQNYGIAVLDEELVQENFDSISALHAFVGRKK